jgi:lipid-A-disaccharide synthase
VASSAEVSVALVAGEVSGDMLAARLLAGLRPQLPNARFHGIGGPRMMEQGFSSDVPMDTLTVRGLFESFPRYREIKGIQNRLRDRLLAERPAAFIGADYPGFNLGLEEQLKAAASRPCTSSARRSGPGAAGASRRSSARSRTCW